MDIRKFAVEETGVLALVGPDDQPLIGEDGKAVTVTLYSPGSKRYANAQAVQSNRLMDRLKKKGKSDQSADEKIRENAEFLAACTKEFSSNISYGEMTGEAMFKAIYSDPLIGFISEQVGKYIADWSNFTKGSATS